jgi:hypothetical protein
MNRRLFVGVRRRPIQSQRHGYLTPRRSAARAFVLSMSSGQCSRAFLFAVLVIVVLGTAKARAADLSKDIRTAPDEGAYQAQITGYVQTEVSIISQDADPGASSHARESLIDNVRGIVDPSPAFLDEYSKQLATALAPLAANPSIRVRLNAAIVVCVVVTKSQSVELAPLIESELNDHSEPVVLWGMKAARAIMLPSLGVPTLKTKLLTAISTAAKRVTSGPVLAAAYSALTVGDQPGQSPVELIVPMQNLLAWRIQQYGTAIPPEPPADGKATSFLTEHAVWLAQTPAQQRATVQELVNLIAAGNTLLSGAQSDDHDQLTALLVQAGKAILVISINTNDPVLRAAATPLATLDQRSAVMPARAACAAAISGLAVKFHGIVLPKGFSASATLPTDPSAPAAPAPTPDQ